MATQNLQAALANNPAAQAELKAAIAASKRGAISSQRVKSTLFYWSKVRLAGVVASSQLTMPAAKVSAFSYGLQQAMVAAGFPTAFGNATEADTNLEQPGQTNSGETVEILGVGIQLCSDTDGELARQIAPHLCVRMVRANGTPTRLGPMTMLPGGGGLFGGASTRLVETPLNQATIERGVISNGYPSALNYRSLPEPILWTTVGTTDGILSVEVEQTRPVTITLPPTRAATAGVAAYIAPGTGGAGTYLDAWVCLYTSAVQARSGNG